MVRPAPPTGMRVVDGPARPGWSGQTQVPDRGGTCRYTAV